MAIDIRKRVAEVLAEELKLPEVYQWVSFADEGFRGAVVIKAHGITDALTKINALGINPGGEVFCIAIPEDKIINVKIEDTNRLLSSKEISEKWGLMTLDEWDEANDVAN